MVHRFVGNDAHCDPRGERALLSLQARQGQKPGRRNESRGVDVKTLVVALWSKALNPLIGKRATVRFKKLRHVSKQLVTKFIHQVLPMGPVPCSAQRRSHSIHLAHLAQLVQSAPRVQSASLSAPIPPRRHHHLPLREPRNFPQRQPCLPCSHPRPARRSLLQRPQPRACLPAQGRWR